jgi:hypothetical protein
MNSESESYVTTDGQSASLSWNKAPIWSLRPDSYYCQTVKDLLMWCALSDERTGLSFRIAAGPRQRSHFRVRVPRDSWSHFTVSDSRLPFSLPPTIRRATMEVFDPASTRESMNSRVFSLFITSKEPNRGHHLERLVHSVIICVLSIAPKCSNLLLSNGGPSVYCVTSRMFTEALSRNGLFRFSGVMSQYYIIQYNIRSGNLIRLFWLRSQEYLSRFSDGYDLEGRGSTSGRGSVWASPASYPIGTDGSLSGDKVAGAWSWPLTSI